MMSGDAKQSISPVTSREAHRRALAMERLPIIRSALKLLDVRIPARLTYHTALHARDVLYEALLFALMEKRLTDHEIELLAIAAAYHDTGYLEQDHHNEILGARRAEEAMKQANYSAEDVRAVVQAIKDTELRRTEQGLQQVSSSLLSDYLLDADVSNFGRDDFPMKARLVQEESGLSTRVFWHGVSELMTAHTWKTQAATTLRQSKKKENMDLVLDTIQHLP